jgi:hypothetical protein
VLRQLPPGKLEMPDASCAPRLCYHSNEHLRNSLIKLQVQVTKYVGNAKWIIVDALAKSLGNDLSNLWARIGRFGALQTAIFARRAVID